MNSQSDKKCCNICLESFDQIKKIQCNVNKCWYVLCDDCIKLNETKSKKNVCLICHADTDMQNLFDIVTNGFIESVLNENLLLSQVSLIQSQLNTATSLKELLFYIICVFWFTWFSMIPAIVVLGICSQCSMKNKYIADKIVSVTIIITNICSLLLVVSVYASIIASIIESIILIFKS